MNLYASPLQASKIKVAELTASIFEPCLPHRTRKAVRQYVLRRYPPYNWVRPSAPYTRSEYYIHNLHCLTMN